MRVVPPFFVTICWVSSVQKAHFNSYISLPEVGEKAVCYTSSPCGEALKIAIHTEQAHFVPIRISIKWQGSRSFSGSCVPCPERLCLYLKLFSLTSISLLADKQHRAMRHHQSSHLCLGFMAASALQPKCFENSRELEMVPMTLNLDGL